MEDHPWAPRALLCHVLEQASLRSNGGAVSRRLRQGSGHIRPIKTASGLRLTRLPSPGKAQTGTELAPVRRMAQILLTLPCTVDSSYGLQASFKSSKDEGDAGTNCI